MIQPAVSVEVDVKPSHAGRERRSATRFPSGLDASCQPVMLRDRSSWVAQVRDISTGGIGLVLPRRFEPKTLLIVFLESPFHEISRTMLVRVVHTTALPDNQWLLGCELTSELDADDLQVFRAEPVRPTSPDCRAWVRFTCDVETACHPAGASSEKPWQVKIVNVSPGGMGLLVPHAVNSKTLIQIELPAAEGRPARTILLRVVQSGQFTPQGWLLNCEFASQLSAEELEELCLL
jgi:hypothetical protein